MAWLSCLHMFNRPGRHRSGKTLGIVADPAFPSGAISLEPALSLSKGPMWFPVYASAVSFGYSTSSTTAPVLAQGNTRYGWLVRPYPARTFTLQENAKLLGAQRL